MKNRNFPGQILAVWILAAKLPNSDLNFAVDFWVDFFLLFFPRRKAPKQSTKKSPAKFTQNFVRKFPVLSWQVEQSSQKTSPAFSRGRFQISNRIPNQISPNFSQTHFCRLGSPNRNIHNESGAYMGSLKAYCKHIWGELICKRTVAVNSSYVGFVLGEGSKISRLCKAFLAHIRYSGGKNIVVCVVSL